MAEPPVLPERAAGVLLHPTSLPGPGVGDLGQPAARFIDWLASAGQQFWQILPLVPVDAGGSPYNGLSALAGNPLLVSPDLLVEQGLVSRSDAEPPVDCRRERVDFPSVLRWKEELLHSAYRAFREGAAPQLADPFEAFRTAHGSWLRDYTLFRALRAEHGGASWLEWPDDLMRRTPPALEAAARRLADQVERFAFQQFLFSRQLQSLRRHARDRGIRIIGDIPIFVAHDSADVWANPDIFELDADGAPTSVAGVPPDYFSATGQRWGNPLYRWDVLRRRDYDWWVARFRRTLEMVDIIRVDHFRGFEAYWEIPASEATAVNGRWVAGPGAEFFHRIEAQLGRLPLIAEDLGLITPEVDALREALGFPGMRVLQFAFDGDPSNPHLPANYTTEAVAYTGTHDNDTILGWWSEVSAAERQRVRRAMGVEDPVAWDFIEAVFASSARLTIAPMQDLLGLGSEARMNTPGRTEDNWSWRIPAGEPGTEVAGRLLELARRTGRARDR
ncbi:MAG: 4-alpha-glucanotransferase [Gemmatimonadota bacterium]